MCFWLARGLLRLLCRRRGPPFVRLHHRPARRHRGRAAAAFASHRSRFKRVLSRRNRRAEHRLGGRARAAGALRPCRRRRARPTRTVHRNSPQDRNHVPGVSAGNLKSGERFRVPTRTAALACCAGTNVSSDETEELRTRPAESATYRPKVCVWLMIAHGGWAPVATPLVDTLYYTCPPAATFAIGATRPTLRSGPPLCRHAKYLQDPATGRIFTMAPGTPTVRYFLGSRQWLGDPGRSTR